MQPIKVLKQECSQSAVNSTNEKAKKLSLFILITHLVNENAYNAQDYPLCGAHWDYKDCYLFSSEH